MPEEQAAVALGPARAAWRGRPPTSHQVVTTMATTSGGLPVHVERDTGCYPPGVQVGAVGLAALPLVRYAFHGEWNCTWRYRRSTRRPMHNVRSLSCC
ncbi:ISAzo13-like element transposase-related protein [Planobispora longispora]|uniref:ISAzo13-like element transposase-related protein n=1 Tax=Planobispora longispora TaxID=28887 RepID=UPI0019420DE6